MKLYYIANARMPTEKAHGIQIAKMCEAFIEADIDLTLVVPHRVTEAKSIEEYYGLRVPIKTIRLPVIDWYTGGRIGYLISSLSFNISYLFFILKKKLAREKFVLYTVDMDNYSSSALAFLGLPLFSEMHGSKLSSFPQRALFRKIKGIIAINKIIIEELKSNFPRSSAKYLVEPNGVDLLRFNSNTSRKEARAQLGLPHDVPIMLYAGRFFEWKGLEIIPQAAEKTPQVRWQIVGGVEEDFARLVKMPLPKNLFFAGDQPHSQMPLWFAAADALLVLGTKRDIQSYRYTSPMKLFEYLAAGRPIVASSTPAIREVVTDKEVIFYTPDDIDSLAEAASRAATQGEKLESLITEAKHHSSRASWRARAERIVKFIGMKTVCFFGIYDPEYSRNRVLSRGFSENNWSVIQCRVNPEEYRGFSKYFKLIKLWHEIKENLTKDNRELDIILVAFPGHTIMWLAKILFPRKKIVFDAFLSRFDSNVYDRKAYGAWSWRGRADWLLDWSSCMLAHKVLLDTKEHGNYFSKTFHIFPNKIIRVPVGTDPLIFYPRSKESHPGKFFVHFHGMFIPLQGLKYIIEAAHILKENTEIFFQIIGSGQQQKEISRMIEERKLTNVISLGIQPLERLPEYIAQADICLGIFGDTDKTTRVIPNKVYEYIAMKKAVITADTPAIREFFTNEKDMLLCKRADAKSLAEAILKLKNDPQLALKLAENSYKYFVEYLQPRMIVSDMLESI